MCGHTISGTLLTIILTTTSVLPATAEWVLNPEELVTASGSIIDVPGYSVPSCTDWNEDGLVDLIVGEGGGGVPLGKVRVYLNQGSVAEPAFGSFVYAQSDGGDLAVLSGGCLGIFPRVLHWDGDGLKDLLAGQSDGTIRLFRNVGTNEAPIFDAGTLVTAGPTGSKTTIDVGSRATPDFVDWNNDGLRDLVVGGMDGRLRLYLNDGTATSPEFQSVQAIQNYGVEDLVVPWGRSSPHVADLTDDGKKDILVGNTEGQIYLYENTGTDASPSFWGFDSVKVEGVSIDLPGTPRSRPCIVDWTGDGGADLLIGASDGRVHLYQGQTTTGVAEGGIAGLVPRLQPAHPNPCRTAATASFYQPETGRIHLGVYDVAGRLIEVLADRVQPAGPHEVTWNAAGHPGLSSGVYFLRLTSASGWSSVPVIYIR